MLRPSPSSPAPQAQGQTPRGRGRGPETLYDARGHVKRVGGGGWGHSWGRGGDREEGSDF